MTPPHHRRRPRLAAVFRAVRRVPVVFAVVLVPGHTSTGDLVLPLVAAVAAVAVAAYASVRRRLRAATRTTPGGVLPTVVPLDELDRRARRLLVETDDCVRTSREELGRAAEAFGDEAVRECAEAVEFAAAQLAQAFRLRQRIDDGESQARALLAEIVERCEAAGRRLDAQAPEFDRIRALERTAGEALERAEARLREVAARLPDAEQTLTGARARYALSACLPVAGHDEQAKDRLHFASTVLDRARQAMRAGATDDAVALLRAAEAATDQTAVLLGGVVRLAAELTAAADRLPAALTDLEADLAQARGLLGTDTARAIAHGESVVARVREESDGEGPFDPVGALRRVEQVAVALDRALHRVTRGSGALGRLDRAVLVARSTVGAAVDQVTTHRGAVGWEARTRLAEAERRLGAAVNTAVPPVAASADALADAREADALAREARRLAERDVRAYGTPYGEGLWTKGAVLGGILLQAPHRPGGHGGPASFGGPATRGRRDAGELFRTAPTAARPSPGTAPAPRTDSAEPPPGP
ncbi:TPM domain-containing protein [Streptomyces sp. NPDC001848]|uniref:TPM domain-containing protein n=1 Tax=Streptomyces sp. NPDC001848 TaxID=3364618 RepID=UPI0036820B31